MNRFEHTDPADLAVCPKTGKPIGPSRLCRGATWLFPLVGICSLLWFLVRVLPKPSRATYPCQRAAAPLASAFVVWLLGFGAVSALRTSLQRLRSARYVLAGLFLLLGVGVAIFTALSGPARWAAAFTPTDPPNTPMGVGKGIHPGRVAWVRDVNACQGEVKWDNSTGYYWDDAHNNQAVIDAMMGKTIRWLAGEATESGAWDALFHYYNRTNNKGDVGYQPGEKIIIKVNLNNAIDWTFPGVTNDNFAVNDLTMYQRDSDNESDVTPQAVIALLRQLIQQAGVPASSIYITDSIRYWTDKYWMRFQACPELNGVHFMDCMGLAGREKIVKSATPQIIYSIHDGTVDYTPAIYQDANYMINFATLKKTSIGITCCNKNHYGSLCVSPAHVHQFGWDNSLGYAKMGDYSCFTDYIAHKDLGGKTFLYLLDGLWAGWYSYGEQSMPHKWQMAPFNNDWPKSFFASQDPVAIDSVALDFLRSESPGDDGNAYSGIAPGADNYLHEAALANNPPSHTRYDPENDGVYVTESLGVHEHWNNATSKQYSRNLGTGAGIELVSTPPATVSVVGASLLNGQNGVVKIKLAAQGNENAVGFTLNFNPAVLQYVSATLGSNAATATLNVNDTQAASGRLGIGMMLSLPQTFPAGNDNILDVTFKGVAVNANSPVTFSDIPVAREVVDTNALVLPSIFANGFVTVLTPNHAPTANNGSATTNQDTPVDITLTGSDPDGDTLKYSIVADPASGLLSGTAPHITYTPNPGYYGTDSFTFKVNDGTLDSNTATVSLTVAHVNHAPAANTGSASTNQDTPVDITLTGSDPDGDTLKYSIVANPASGLLSGTAPHITYTPNPGYYGTDSFTFKVNDGTQDSNTATVSLTVTHVNHAPSANNGNVSVSEDIPAAITLTGSDPDADSLKYLIVGVPAHGNLTGAAPNLTYTPTANYVGTDSFTFKVNDGAVDSNLATVSITVTPVNDPPVASNGTLTMNEDTLASGKLIAVDGDSTTLLYTIVAKPAKGSVNLNQATGNYTYTPNPNANGTDSFTFQASDNITVSNIATVSVNITPVNDLPIANPDSATTFAATPVKISVLANDTDVDGDTLTVTVVTQSKNGSVVINAGTAVTYTPKAGFIGADQFSYTISDGHGGTVKGNVTITVTAKPLTAVTLTASPASPQRSKTRITLTATATGGTKVEYRFRVGYNSGGIWYWTYLGAYSTANSVRWTPTTAMTYTLEVWAREVGHTTTYDVNNLTNYTITVR